MGVRGTPVPSHPSRVRGLKRHVRARHVGPRAIAPFTGAWIETSPCSCQVEGWRSHPSRVRGLKLAPAFKLLGTLTSHPSRVRGLKHGIRRIVPCCERSHPSRVRGLKHARRDGRLQPRGIAPFTGAWIETLMPSLTASLRASHPSRVRGLKLGHVVAKLPAQVSHPSRVRGLKPGSKADILISTCYRTPCWCVD